MFFTMPAAYAQVTNDQPLVTRKKLPPPPGVKDSGTPVLQVATIRLPNGQQRNLVGVGKMTIGFFINGQFYAEEAAEKLDWSAFNSPDLKWGVSWNSEYAVPDSESYAWICWIGTPPPLSERQIRFLAVNAKYTGKTIVGVIKEATVSSYNHQPSGFMLESGNDLFRVDVQQNEVPRLMKQLVVGDIVIIQVSWAGLGDDKVTPIITPRVLIKDGEKLINNGSVQI